MFANSLEQVTLSGNILTKVADHFPQFMTIKHASTSYKNLSSYEHEYIKLNEDRLLNSFENLDC